MNNILGLRLDPKDLTFLQISLRAIIVYVVALAIMRVANKRFLSKTTAFDALLGFMLGTMLARVINGSGAFFPSLGVGFVLVGLHRLVAAVAFVSDRFGNLVKGRSAVLVQNGQANPQALRSNNISQEDLLEELRLNGEVGSAWIRNFSTSHVRTTSLSPQTRSCPPQW